MGANIINGKEIAAQIRAGLAERVAALKEQRKELGLTVVLVGENPASQVYVRNKEKASAEIGINGKVCRLPESTTQEELLALIDKLNRDSSVHGILVQLPLPKHINELAVIDAIDPAKDVDGFHVQSAGSLLVGRQGFVACTPKGIMRLLASTGVPLEGKKAVVIGRSNIVGKPVALLLLQANATVTICHSRTKNLKEEVRAADIVVAAIGKADFITGDMIKPGAIVIDVGMNRREDGKLTGDVNFEQAAQVAGWITPVPGGVGPMTIAMLLENTVEAGENHG